ncbi:hypothetical protein, partial [Streptomyces clavuligerus]
MERRRSGPGAAVNGEATTPIRPGRSTAGVRCPSVPESGTDGRRAVPARGAEAAPDGGTVSLLGAGAG